MVALLVVVLDAFPQPASASEAIRIMQPAMVRTMVLPYLWVANNQKLMP
jgi:hypothetical protein